ncbi:AAA family ATPase [Thalassospira xiamenensis]|uniref:ATPase family associated with various cellular activities (AAA) n=1 Tax=Thalassospira xiamenensis TaxID=220697 RepID=A0A285TGX2_9PROT|nr:AAA family ATPase [Thalassospira xiamenensis]SOC21399.1 ATPase family associated with various cellular activities (AAA) [Thalassospira xiamenensis]
MSIEITVDALLATHDQKLEPLRQNYCDYKPSHTITVSSYLLTESVLTDLRDACLSLNNTKLAQQASILLEVKKGADAETTSVPNFNVFAQLLKSYLAERKADGWVYIEAKDGRFYPFAVLSVKVIPARTMPKTSKHVALKLACIAPNTSSKEGAFERQTMTVDFYPIDVTRKKVGAILEQAGVYPETKALREAYDASMKSFKETFAPKFAEQMIATGRTWDAARRGQYCQTVSMSNRKAVQDTEFASVVLEPCYLEVHTDDVSPNQDPLMVEVPVHPVLRLYDLMTHEWFYMHCDYLEVYEYDESVREKLILPETHVQLLDVLTSDLSKKFRVDFIAGKATGTIVLSRGLSGLGKTLTAEVYSEIRRKALLKIHAGNLGTDPEKIVKSLRHYFDLSLRWELPVLLDEADVFVMQRGSNMQHNAVVAEFLRVLEYFEGTMFLTTNRSDEIDDAIVQRCAAIINYERPDPHQQRAIWKVMADQQNAVLDDGMLDQLLQSFPSIRPRDIRELLSLTLRMNSTTPDSPLTIEDFRKWAVFRAIDIEKLSGRAGN